VLIQKDLHAWVFLHEEEDGHIIIKTVWFSRDPPKVVHTPKTFALIKHPTNILCKEKHIHGIVFALT